MRRYNDPYNGQRFVLNKNTGEIHDLDNETPSCKIDEIKPEHVYNCETYQDAQLHAVIVDQKNVNGCFYCLPSKDNG